MESVEPVVSPKVWSRPAGKLRSTFARYRALIGPEIAWRDRHVFLGQGTELRSPMNDLRIEALMTTPDWVKQFTGQYRENLRHALIRRDYQKSRHEKIRATYRRAGGRRMRDRERACLELGLGTIARFPGICEQRIAAEYADWLHAGCPANYSLYAGNDMFLASARECRCYRRSRWLD